MAKIRLKELESHLTAAQGIIDEWRTAVAAEKAAANAGGDNATPPNATPAAQDSALAGRGVPMEQAFPDYLRMQNGTYKPPAR